VGASILLESPKLKPQKKPLHFCKGFVFCSSSWARTKDPLINSQML
jgi:hypothetical protein